MRLLAGPLILAAKPMALLIPFDAYPTNVLNNTHERRVERIVVRTTGPGGSRGIPLAKVTPSRVQVRVL